jgi:NAD(P)-dependent dehydrogenase (short-subunit alcohol dehydrogenase family)
MYSFENKKALLVGAGSGIGRAVALELSRRGVQTVVADIDAQGAAGTAGMIDEAGGRALALTCDVTDDASVARAVREAEGFLGTIDIAVNTAGVLLNGNPEDIPLPEWERIFGVNVFGAARLVEHVLPPMLARGAGYVVTTASVAGLYPFATSRIPYAASKAALISLSQNLAIYLRPRGIRVSCLCPGPTVTSITDTMKTWSDNVTLRGPGSHLRLMPAGEAAAIFCDGMAADRFLIASHEPETTELLRQFAASPDNFLYEKIGRFACSENGLPNVDPTDPAIAGALEALKTSGK